MLAKLKEKNIDVVFVPASCTDMLQPLDLAINKPFKDYMKAEFNTYYSNEVSTALGKGVHLTQISIDLHSSVIKPKPAGWMVNAFQKLAGQTTLIQSAWSMAGIKFE